MTEFLCNLAPPPCLTDEVPTSGSLSVTLSLPFSFTPHVLPGAVTLRDLESRQRQGHRRLPTGRTGGLRAQGSV